MEQETAGPGYPPKGLQGDWEACHLFSSKATCRGKQRCWGDAGEQGPGLSGQRSVSASVIFSLVLTKPSAWLLLNCNQMCELLLILPGSTAHRLLYWLRLASGSLRVPEEAASEVHIVLELEIEPHSVPGLC